MLCNNVFCTAGRWIVLPHAGALATMMSALGVDDVFVGSGIPSSEIVLTAIEPRRSNGRPRSSHIRAS